MNREHFPMNGGLVIYVEVRATRDGQVSYLVGTTNSPELPVPVSIPGQKDTFNLRLRAAQQGLDLLLQHSACY